MWIWKRWGEVWSESSPTKRALGRPRGLVAESSGLFQCGNVPDLYRLSWQHSSSDFVRKDRYFSMTMRYLMVKVYSFHSLEIPSTYICYVIRPMELHMDSWACDWIPNNLLLRIEFTMNFNVFVLNKPITKAKLPYYVSVPDMAWFEVLALLELGYRIIQFQQTPTGGFSKQISDIRFWVVYVYSCIAKATFD